MTSNQISLRKVKEDERHNRVTEAEERRHNVTTESYTAEHYERSDQAALQQAWASASQAETAKGNMAINAINAETQRYVAETGRLSYQESARHNEVVERENYRHNTKTESNDLIKARAAESQASSEAKRVNAYIALTAAQVEDILVTQLRERKLANAQIEHWGNQDLYDQRRVETDRLKALADAEYKAQELAIRREQMSLNWSQLDLDRYKANLEGLKFKSDQKPKKDSGGGIITGLKNLGDSVFQLFS